jgi:hypothetical protein
VQVRSDLLLFVLLLVLLAAYSFRPDPDHTVQNMLLGTFAALLAVLRPRSQDVPTPPGIIPPVAAPTIPVTTPPAGSTLGKPS